MGLKTVRELVLRCPLVMSGELLSDLAQYKKFREKEVASAARWVRGRVEGATTGTGRDHCLDAHTRYWGRITKCRLCALQSMWASIPHHTTDTPWAKPLHNQRRRCCKREIQTLSAQSCWDGPDFTAAKCPPYRY